MHLLRYLEDKQKAAQAAAEMKRSMHQQLHAVEVRKQAEAALEQQVGSRACCVGPVPGAVLMPGGWRCCGWHSAKEMLCSMAELHGDCRPCLPCMQPGLLLGATYNHLRVTYALPNSAPALDNT
jgi:hypothetical protein